MKKVIALFLTVLICFSVLSSNLLTVSAQCNDNSASLEPLLKYSDLPKDTVVDAVYRGIINAGGSSQIASNVSLAIKIVWDLLLF